MEKTTADDLWDKIKLALAKCPEDFTAWAFDITPRALRHHVTNGMPKGDAGFDLRAVIAWRLARLESVTRNQRGSGDAKSRKDKADALRKEEQAEILKMTRERMAGLLIPRANYDGALKAMGAHLRNALRGLGREMGDKLARERDGTKIAGLLDARMSEILETMYAIGDRKIADGAEVEIDAAAGPNAMVTAVAAQTQA